MERWKFLVGNRIGMDGGEKVGRCLSSLDSGDTEEKEEEECLRRLMFVVLILCSCEPEIFSG
jgi:hypothetical protein